MTKQQDYYIHELLDRLHVIQNNVEDHIIAHPGIDLCPGLREKIETIQKEFSDAYQLVGAHHLE